MRHLAPISPCLLLILSLACGTGFSSGRDQVTRSRITVSNHDDASRSAMYEAVVSSYTINMEVVRPRIISSTPADRSGTVTDAAGIEGIAVVRAVVDENGRIMNYSIVRRAGLGLDDMIPEIMKGMKIRPAHQAGLPWKTICSITIRFRQ